MSTLKTSDPCTDMILDLISERESNGNYNAVIGNAGAHDDLGAKSITEIYALMQERRAAGMSSTAIGRYQIIRGTLRGLQKALNISDDELFTPELQDKMAVRLMVGRGYKSWWRGGMSNEEFAHGLSCEWASLPDPENGGRSHYHGVGPNHAGMTLGHVYNALDAARKLKPGF